MWNVENILDPDERSQICAALTDALPDWFGQADANASYIEGVRAKDAFVVRGEDGAALGLLSLRHPYPTNADIYWMGIRPDCHRRGIGAALFDAALIRARALGCETMSVETLSDTSPDPAYARTRLYYKAMGFKPLFELHPYRPANPMLYMLKQL